MVDDDAGQRLLASAALLQGGFSVLEAADGEQALSLFQREQPDIVLLDVIMPGLDGFAVCEVLRQLPGGQHLPIVMVTGLDDVESIERAYQVGATDFITQPIQWLVLHHRVRYILRASQTLLELRESEERFRTLIQATGSVILVLDRKGRVMEFNPAAQKFYPFQQGEPVGADFMAVLPSMGNWSGLEGSRSGERCFRPWMAANIRCSGTSRGLPTPRERPPDGWWWGRILPRGAGPRRACANSPMRSSRILFPS